MKINFTIWTLTTSLRNTDVPQNSGLRKVQDPNPPTNPTKGTPPHPGPDQHPKTGKNQPQIDEK